VFIDLEESEIRCQLQEILAEQVDCYMAMLCQLGIYLACVLDK